MPRVTVVLNKEREAAVEASGKTLVELIDLGLDSLAEQGDKITGPERVASARRNWGALNAEDCKHPRARRAKGLCMACGTYIGTQ